MELFYLAIILDKLSPKAKKNKMLFNSDHIQSLGHKIDLQEGNQDSDI